jgi:hypothetical protein
MSYLASKLNRRVVVVGLSAIALFMSEAAGAGVPRHKTNTNVPLPDKVEGHGKVKLGNQSKNFCHSVCGFGN